MSLLLTVYNNPHWKLFAENCGLPLINEAAPQINTTIAVLQPTQSLPTLSAMLSGLAEEQTLWLAVVQAEYFLAGAIENGATLTGAAQQWTQQTKALLDLQRQQRRKLQLFNLHQALAHPTQFHQLLNINLTFSNYSAHDDTSNISLLAASQYLAQQSELQTLNARLQASVLPLCMSETLSLNIEQTLLRNHSLQTAAQERDLLLSQLHHVQEELESSHRTNQSALTTANQTQAQLQQQLEKETTEKNAALQECDLLLSQLHNVQEELESNHLTNQSELTTAIQAQAQLQQQLEKETTEKNAALQERDLIISQLHLVQEKLESSHLTNQSELTTAIQAQAQLQQQLEKETAAKNKAQQTSNQFEADLKKAIAACDQLQQQLIDTTAEKNAALQKITQLETDCQSSVEECNLILQQLHQVQEQLEQYYLALQTEQQQHKHTLLARDKQHTKEIAKLESELRKTKARASSAEYAGQLLHQELEKLRSSISWKAAKPVRVIGRIIKKKKPTNDKLTQDIGLLLTSEYFDVDWYLRAYTDVAESQMNPAEHYLMYGAAEGRLPGPLFDGNWYLQHYPDVAESKINPLLHFVMFGQQEGRNSSPKMLTNDQSAEDES